MRLILSRKGFDSGSGGCPSPILPDGTMLSLPIPDRNSRIAYREIEYQGVNIGQLIADLTGDTRRLRHYAHLDPDLDRASLPRADGWRPLLGQTGIAQGHLRKQSVQAGDLFLFFGLFRPVERTGSGWRFIRRDGAKHVLWGWLQIGRIHKVDELTSETLPWARYHPHFQGKRDVNNTLYIAADGLRLNGREVDAPGAGLFRQIDDRLILTDPDAGSLTRWRLPAAFYPDARKPPLSYHGTPERWQRGDGYCTLQSASRGQEFVLDTARYPGVTDWLSSLLAEQALERGPRSSSKKR
ncbi:MAG: hypothetical protein OXF11_09810 [Deltaproteobacteria bacterium]|nr:hypothetical protein [Deltaproteobacteria bacterium]